MKTAIASCYSKHNYGSMLQAYATQMALDKLGWENETIDISGFHEEIKKSKFRYFIKASLTSDILISKFGNCPFCLWRSKTGSKKAASFCNASFYIQHSEGDISAVLEVCGKEQKSKNNERNTERKSKKIVL